MDDLKISIEKGIQKIVLNRPRKKNAITKLMYENIAAALNSAAEDDNVIMTVFTGEGDFYSSGNDITGYLDASADSSDHDDLSSGFTRQLKVASKTIQDFVSSFIDFPKILVAIVNGPAIGIAATTLGLFDLVYASDRAYFLTPFTRLGLTAEGCSTLTFPRIIGPRKAIEMLYFNHKMTAKEAKEYNFVTDVLPHAELNGVWSRLHKYLSLPSGSILSVKKLVRNIDRRELHLANISECKELEKRWQSEEFATGLQNFLSSRL